MTTLTAPDDVALTSDPIADAVRRAWTMALGARAADPDKSILDMRVGAGRIVRLLESVEDSTGVALPVTVVFQAPTCAALTEIVRGGVAPPPARIVVLKPGDDSTPLFIVPGLGATVFELLDMCRRIDCPGPVLACQPPGPDGFVPHRSVFALAEDLAQAVTLHVPAGPYRLVGYSLGGLVALEMARLLRARGADVEFLGLLDTAVPEPYWPTSERIGYFMKRLKVHARAMRGRGAIGSVVYASGHVRTFLGRLRRMALGAGEGSLAASPYRLEGLPPALEQVRNANIDAFNSYKLTYYDGAVTLFNSAEGDPLCCNPLNVWPRWIRHLKTHQVPGSHETMLRGRYAPVLAAAISQALRGLETAPR
jgi:thioesterase domain-containing protein